MDVDREMTPAQFAGVLFLCIVLGALALVAAVTHSSQTVTYTGNVGLTQFQDGNQVIVYFTNNSTVDCAVQNLYQYQKAYAPLQGENITIKATNWWPYSVWSFLFIDRCEILVH